MHLTRLYECTIPRKINGTPPPKVLINVTQSDKFRGNIYFASDGTSLYKIEVKL